MRRIPWIALPLVLLTGFAAAQPNVWHVVNGVLTGDVAAASTAFRGPVGCEVTVPFSYTGNPDTGWCHPEAKQLEMVIDSYPLLNLTDQSTSRPLLTLLQDVTDASNYETFQIVGNGTSSWVLASGKTGTGTQYGMIFRGGGAATATGWEVDTSNMLIPETDGEKDIGQVSGSVRRIRHLFSAGGLFAASVSPTASYTLGSGNTLMTSATAPTISSGFGTSPSIAANNGTAAFTINVGTGGTANSGVIGFPTATTGWAVQCMNTSTNTATVFLTKQTATTTTTATIGNYDAAGAAAAWVASNVLVCSAIAY